MIKKYAVWARRELIERVSQKALQYGITADGKADPNADSVNGRLMTDAEKKQRRALIRKVNEHGYEQVIEEVAYTWFNRFAALRFMEVNGYLPSHVRVFTNDSDEFKPQILSEAIHLDLDGLSMDKVYELKNADKDEELFKYLLVTQCNALFPILPKMFQRIADDTELLLPDYLLREGSVIHQMVALIPAENWRDQVQIIGWLYQYYNTEPKEKVFANLKKNIKITKENIPAATQLFTPDWIVRYMVENSLGRLWLEGHPNDALKSQWRYYLDEAEQEAKVQAQLDAIRREYAAMKPEDIRCIDPCMGSGHILCYLFDVLVQIYEDYGHTARAAVGSIVEKNLWGLDIDGRAAQLAYFSVMMKARQYDRRFFAHPVQPHTYSPKGYPDGEEFGSLLTVDELEPMPEELEETTLFDEDYETRLNRWNFRQALAQKYHVVCTNPPYMGTKGMNPRIAVYIKEKYEEGKSDLFAVFIQRLEQLTIRYGFYSLVTQRTWLFITAFEKLRQTILQISTGISFVELGAGAFEDLAGEVVQSVLFCMVKGKIVGYKSGYIDLTQEENKGSYYFTSKKKQIKIDSFSLLPGTTFAMKLSNNALSAYRDKVFVGKYAQPKKGLISSDNNRFLRLWYEVNIRRIQFNLGQMDKQDSTKRWLPHNKGGSFRRWYGNHEYIINWEHNGAEVKGYAAKLYGSYSRQIMNEKYYLQESISWSSISSHKIGVRYYPIGFTFDTAGPSMFITDKAIRSFIFGLLGSCVAEYYIKATNPTINLLASDIANLPLLGIERSNQRDKIVTLVESNVELAKIDWDSFETSWDFKKHPLAAYAALSPEQIRQEETSGFLVMNNLADAYRRWERACNARFNQLKANEEELNRIFIHIYDLQDELTPEVEDKDVTVRKADLSRDVRSLISYAVGCMFGRYSLDMEGLAYAGGQWDISRYTTFQPDKDAILPICDDDYFEDDIVGRFVEWVETVYGKGTLEENLKFIADALGGKGSPREVIRKYFLGDFYADHCKIYQKRPIYWLFDSGKKNGFKCLIYLHRYQPDTIARIRTDYVHEQQARYRTAIADLEQRVGGASTSERVKLSKRLAALQAQAEEIREYEEKIHHLADQMIKIDLDEGVKKNYAIFQDVLAKIK